MKFVVIGGNAAGMSAASRVRRKDPSWEIIVLEQTREVSYGACGLPYYVAGLNDDIDLIRIRSVAEFEKAGILMKTECTVQWVDFGQKMIHYTDSQGANQTESYDKLLVATGASPRIPPIPGIEKKGIYPLKTLGHAEDRKSVV